MLRIALPNHNWIIRAYLNKSISLFQKSIKYDNVDDKYIRDGENS
jgi:hypothetical protein